MSAITSFDHAQISRWQASFLTSLPGVKTHAQIQFRDLPVSRREEAIQEATAAAWVSDRRLALSKRLDVCYPSTLANFAVSHVRNGRHIGGRQDSAKDVMSPVAHQRHGVHCQRESACSDSEWKELVVENRRTSIADLAAFRIDFADWLRSMTRRQRRIIVALARGEGTATVAQKFGLTPGRISQLRRQFQREWTALQRQALEGIRARGESDPVRSAS